MAVVAADTRTEGPGPTIEGLLDALELGEGWLRARDLGRLAATIAAHEELWRPMLHLDPTRRWYKRLYLGENLDVWLLGWDVSQETTLHDHGGSSGAFCVTEGALTERFTAKHRGHLSRRLHRAGHGATSFGPGYIHVVTNEGPGPAASIHAYSPPLVAMTIYERRGFASLRALETVATDTPEPPPADQPPRRSIDEVLAVARRRVRRLGPAEAAAAVAAGAALVDIRSPEQRRDQGEVPGAVTIPRNVLEWRLDPTSDARIPDLASYERQIVVMCVEGYASSLAVRDLQDLGLTNVCDLDGGFRAWCRAGLPVTEPAERR